MEIDGSDDCKLCRQEMLVQARIATRMVNTFIQGDRKEDVIRFICSELTLKEEDVQKLKLAINIHSDRTRFRRLYLFILESVTRIACYNQLNRVMICIAFNALLCREFCDE